MAKLARWQEDYIKHLESLSNADLFEQMIHTQIPNSWDGEFTARGGWYANQSIVQIRERLKDWLEESP